LLLCALFSQNDLQRFGASIDWRRTFVTTSINPYYDAFIRWQFNVLKKRNFIAFGNRATVFSRVEGQACADHERLHGEGVGPQEYLGVKIRAQKVPREIEWIASKYSVFFIAATLRPETLYGQTNCFVLPTGEYGIYLALDERITKADNIDVYCAVMEEKEAYDKCHQVFICSERSALNMAYQGLLPVTQDANGLYNTICLGTITGDKLIGLPLSSPNTVYTTIYMLPMMTISLNKGHKTFVYFYIDVHCHSIFSRYWNCHICTFRLSG
jgi:leucyl-tRNA synthetase